MRADIGIALDGDADRVVIVDEKGRIVDGDQIMAVIAESWHRRGKLTAGGVVATVMSNLGLERYLTEHRPRPGAHAGRRPLRRRAHAQARLQRRRRAVRPHRAVRFHHHRRRAGRGAAGAVRRRRHGQAGERGVQALRAAAADPAERALRRRHAAGAGRCVKQAIDLGGKARLGGQRPPRHPPVGHRARHPRDGRGRRRAASCIRSSATSSRPCARPPRPREHRCALSAGTCAPATGRRTRRIPSGRC